MGLKLTTDKYPPITSQTRYPLRHATSIFEYYIFEEIHIALFPVAFYMYN